MTGNENHDITLSEAAAMTENYRNSLTSSTATIAHYFGKTAIQNILAQADCIGMRIYYALDDSGNQQLVVTGVTADGNDMYQGKLADRSVPCPQYCSAANPLNTTPTS